LRIHRGFNLSIDNIPEIPSAESQVLHPGSRLLFRTWERLRGATPCPSRASFRLADVKQIIPNLFILDYTAYANSFRYRLAGTMLTEFHGRDMTGANPLADWDAFEQQMQAKVLKTARLRFQPALIRSRHYTLQGEAYGAEVLALPFSAGAELEPQIIGGLFPFSPARGLSFVRKELVTVRSIHTEYDTGDSLLRRVERSGSPLLRVIAGGKD
jgi:hypothetical protein